MKEKPVNPLTLLFFVTRDLVSRYTLHLSHLKSLVTKDNLPKIKGITLLTHGFFWPVDGNPHNVSLSSTFGLPSTGLVVAPLLYLLTLATDPLLIHSCDES